MSIVRVQGIVIGEVNIGEADKILTILTKKYGKIQALSKGARRLKSALIACSQPLVYSDFIFYKGKDIYKLSSGEVIESFYDIRSDLERFAYASYITDIIKEITRENISSYKVIQLFLNTLYMLTKTNHQYELITRAFEFRVMSLIGYKPQVDCCSLCAKNERLTGFCFSSNGLVCQECFENKGDTISILEGTANALKYIIKCDLKQLFSFSASEAVLKELKMISKIYLKDKLDKELKPLDLKLDLS
jgi:DNA repair protein RecO (recombination protein O)